MTQFFEKNKTFIAIITGSIIIGSFVYLSKAPTDQPVSKNSDLSDLGFNLDNSKTDKAIVDNSILKCISYTEAENHIGENGCVTGRVDNVYTSSKGNNFLNFCANYKTCSFSSVIFSSDAYKFSDIKGYEGKNVEITGLIKSYKGNAEIIINDPSQIKIK